LDGATNGGQGGKVNMVYDLSTLTLDIIGKIGFAQDFNAQQIAEKDNIDHKNSDMMMREVVLRTINPLHRFVPTPQQMKVREIQASGVERSKLMFDAAVEAAGKEGALPNMISVMKDAQNPSLTYSEIKDEIFTIRAAGHETTSNTLSWALYLLSDQQNSHALEKIRHEVETLVKGNIATFEELKKLKYCTWVFYETLRLFPTVPSFPRLSVEDTTLQGYDIPKGSMVFITQSPMNRNPDTWENPDVFCPERFEKVAELTPSKPVGVPDGHKFGFLPFGAGPRTCIGQRLALMEGVHILAAIVKNFNFAMQNPGEVVQECAGILLNDLVVLDLCVHSYEIRITCNLIPRELRCGNYNLSFLFDYSLFCCVDITLGPKKGLHMLVTPRLHR
jgi:cytochrome P450